LHQSKRAEGRAILKKEAQTLRDVGVELERAVQDVLKWKKAALDVNATLRHAALQVEARFSVAIAEHVEGLLQTRLFQGAATNENALAIYSKPVPAIFEPVAKNCETA